MPSYNYLLKQTRIIASSPSVKSNLPKLVFFTDSNKLSNVYSVVKSLKPNILIIIRDYDHPQRELFAKEIIKLAKRRGNKILIAGDYNLAIKLNADGVHLPQYKAYQAKYIKNLSAKLIVTSSAHCYKSVKNLNLLPLDAIFVSPIFKTTSHAKQKPKRVKFLSVMRLLSQKPVYALGGVNFKNIKLLNNLAINGIAGIDVFDTKH